MSSYGLYVVDFGLFMLVVAQQLFILETWVQVQVLLEAIFPFNNFLMRII